MNFFKNLRWKGIFLTGLVLIVESTAVPAAPPADVAPIAAKTSGQTCKSLRREMSQLFEQVYAKVPSLMDTIMTTAHEHNIGRRFEFGADVIKRLIVNAFTSYLPPCIHPTQGRDLSVEVVKAQVPEGQQPEQQPSSSPVYSFNTKDSSSGRSVRSGDATPAKLRKRRSSSNAEIGSDYLLINDAAIPLDLFQHHGGNEEEEEKNQITLELYV